MFNDVSSSWSMGMLAEIQIPDHEGYPCPGYQALNVRIWPMSWLCSRDERIKFFQLEKREKRERLIILIVPLDHIPYPAVIMLLWMVNPMNFPSSPSKLTSSCRIWCFEASRMTRIWIEHKRQCDTEHFAVLNSYQIVHKCIIPSHFCKWSQGTKPFGTREDTIHLIT
jgi:hypothetical protein